MIPIFYRYFDSDHTKYLVRTKKLASILASILTSILTSFFSHIINLYYRLDDPFVNQFHISAMLKVLFTFFAVVTATITAQESDADLFGNRLLKKTFCSSEREGGQCGLTKKNGEACQCFTGDDEKPTCVEDNYDDDRGCVKNKDCPKNKICWSNYCIPLCKLPYKASVKFPTCSAINQNLVCGLAPSYNDNCRCGQTIGGRYTCLGTSQVSYCSQSDPTCLNGLVCDTESSYVCKCGSDNDCESNQICNIEGFCYEKCERPF